jgi:hypothetical protein
VTDVALQEHAGFEPVDCGRVAGPDLKLESGHLLGQAWIVERPFVVGQVQTPPKQVSRINVFMLCSNEESPYLSLRNT